MLSYEYAEIFLMFPVRGLNQLKEISNLDVSSRPGLRWCWTSANVFANGLSWILPQTGASEPIKFHVAFGSTFFMSLH